eukprot:GHVR01029475.1.p1 GENE.GHVR01029475.1~~GHVR01029475.1.p1  ORF type:complete len:163 (-),score=27.64 GHVR01029475.1:215-703(-)
MKFQKTSIKESILITKIHKTCGDNDMKVIRAGMSMGVVPNTTNCLFHQFHVSEEDIKNFWTNGCSESIVGLDIEIEFPDYLHDIITLRGPIVNKLYFKEDNNNVDPWNFTLRNSNWSLHVSVGTRLIHDDTLYEHHIKGTTIKEFLLFYSRYYYNNIIIRGK